jgi:hypothetical protein
MWIEAHWNTESATFSLSDVSSAKRGQTLVAWHVAARRPERHLIVRGIDGYSY